MSREEAIKWLNDYLQNTPFQMEQYEKAFVMAIQALSQEPTEKLMTVDEMEREYEKSKALFHKIVECDDAISRSVEWQNGYLQGVENTAKEFKVEIERFKCEDAISREDAEQMFRNIRSHLKPQDYKSAEEFNTRDLMLLNAEQMIHALPSVTQKSGKWHIAHGMYEDRFWCSCGYIRIMDSRMNEWKYCPVCGGAKMVEPQESEG